MRHIGKLALGVAGAVQGLNLAIQALSREIAETLRPLPAPAR